MSLSPRADQVRTARLVAAVAARRSGVSEELLDDVRLAVAEACSRAVRRHVNAGSVIPIDVTFTDDDDEFTVSVADHVGGRTDQTGPTSAQSGPTAEQATVDIDLADPDALSLAVIAGLISSHIVRAGSTPGSTRVVMSWPRSA